MNPSKPSCQRTLVICVFLIIGEMFVGSAQILERPLGPEHPNALRSFLKRPIESTAVGVSFLSYKPQLEQFTDLLKGLGSPGIDAALMSVISVTLTHTPALSSRVDVGYWANDTQIPPPTSADLSATFIPVSLNLIYRPFLLQALIPLYVGGGVGYSRLNVEGSALDLLKQQGVTVDEANSGLTGYALIGLEYLLVDNRLSLTLEAKQVLKTFTTSGTPPLDLDFDGAAVGLGVGFRF